MERKLKPYSSIRNSKIEWLGEIPVEWKIRRLKKVAQIIMGQSPQSENCNYEQIGVPFLQGCAEFENENPVPIQFCKSPPILCPSGSILLSVRAPVGRLNTADQIYGIGRGLCAVVPNSNHLSKKFTRYLLELIGDELQIVSTGSTYDSVTVGNVGSLLLILPSTSEQTAIVRYLDYMEKRIKKYVQVNKKLVELYNELKKVIIHSVVTRGLDSSIQFKESGIEWLGKIPAHWKVAPLKRLCLKSALYGANVSSKRYAKSGVRFLRITDISEDGEIKKGGVFLPKLLVKDYLLKHGDLIISRSGTIGRSFIYESDVHGICSYAGYLVRFVPSTHVAPQYLYLFTKTNAFADFLQMKTISTTIQNVNAEKYANCMFLFPPMSEQNAIVEYLNNVIKKLNLNVNRCNRQIALMQEFRAKLIYDVVTGKLDVREAALNLPQDSDSADTLKHKK